MTTPTALELFQQKQAEQAEQNESGSTDTNAPEVKFAKYTSSRESMRIITDAGFRVTFTKFTYITENPEVIQFLDTEIKLGLNVIKREEDVTSSDLNPMAAMRKKFFAEFEAEQKKEAMAKLSGESKDMGSTAIQDLKAAHTGNVAG